MSCVQQFCPSVPKLEGGNKFQLKLVSTDTVKDHIMHVVFSPGATTPIGGCILQPSSGL